MLLLLLLLSRTAVYLTKLAKAPLLEWLPGAAWGTDGGRGVGRRVGVNVMGAGLNNEVMVSVM